MSELLQIQRALQRYLCDQASDLDDIVLETERVPRAVRLNIYANAYRARLVESLSVDFGMLCTYLGEDEFTGLVHAYIERHPSRYFSLRGVGAELVAFLQATEPYAEYIDVQELAQFEWALCHVFDAADSPCAERAALAALPPERWPGLTLCFVPALRVLELRSNAPSIWRALSAGQTPPAATVAEMPDRWLLWRRDLKLLFRPLDNVENIVLATFAAGGTFADVCGELAAVLPEDAVPPRAAALLQQWLQDGLIAAQ